MRRRITAAAAAVLMLFTACAEDPPPKTAGGVRAAGVRSSSQQSSATSEEETASEQVDEMLLQMAQDLTNESFHVETQCPETRASSSVQVNEDSALHAQVAALLTQHTYELGVKLPELNPEGTVKEITIKADNNKLFSHLTLYGYHADHPVYPNKTLLVLENSSGATRRYLYSKEVFDQIYTEVQKRLSGVAVAFTGNLVRLRSHYDLTKIERDKGLYAGEFLQFSDRMIWRFSQPGTGQQALSVVEAFDLARGTSLFNFTVNEKIDHIEKYTGLSGYDYRIFTPGGILYKNSQDPSVSESWIPPSAVKLFTASVDLSGTYDLRYGKLAYAAQDGIYIADTDGTNARLLLSHGALAAAMAGVKPAVAPDTQISVWYFNNPRIMKNAEKMVTSIVSPQTGENRLGFAVTDLETGETNYFTEISALDARGVHYPNDTVLAVQNPGAISLVDVNTLDIGTMPLDGLEGSTFFTNDYDTFLICERPYDLQTKTYPADVYITSSDAMHDRSRKVLSSRGDTFYPVDITEEYLIGLCRDSRGLVYTASKYRTAPVVQLPQTADSDEMIFPEDENFDDEDSGEELLPPDITPEL